MRHVIRLPLSRARTLHKNTRPPAWRPIRGLHLGFLSTQVAVYRRLAYGQESERKLGMNWMVSKGRTIDGAATSVTREVLPRRIIQRALRRPPSL